MLALTGQRRDEIGSLRWQEVDFGKAVIALPAEHTKNGKPHDIPLSAPALGILEKLHASAGDREFVFGIRASGFQGWSKSKETLDASIALPACVIRALQYLEAGNDLEVCRSKGPDGKQALNNYFPILRSPDDRRMSGTGTSRKGMFFPSAHLLIDRNDSPHNPSKQRKDIRLAIPPFANPNLKKLNQRLAGFCPAAT